MSKNSESVQITIKLVQSIITVLNMAGNSLVCVVIVKNRDMRTSINYLLVNLAVADMTVALFFASRYILIHAYTHPDGVAGTVLCRLLTGGNLGWVGADASVFTLVTVAIERYYAVLYPFENKGKLTKGKLKVIIPCSWIFGVITTIPLFLVKNFDEKLHHCMEMWPEKWMGQAYSLTYAFLLTFLPVSLIVAVYSRVVYTLWFKSAGPNKDNHCQQGVMRARKRVTLMVVIVSAIFGVCWLTESTEYVLMNYTPTLAFGDATYHITSTLVLLNSAINPIVYALVSHRFREKIKGMMCCSCRPKINRIEHFCREPRRMEVVNSRKGESSNAGEVCLTAYRISINRSDA